MEYAFIAHSLSFSSNLLTNQLYRLTKDERHTLHVQPPAWLAVNYPGKWEGKRSPEHKTKNFLSSQKHILHQMCFPHYQEYKPTKANNCPFLQGHMTVAFNGAAANIAVRLTPRLTIAPVQTYFYREYVHICKCHRKPNDKLFKTDM